LPDTALVVERCGSLWEPAPFEQAANDARLNAEAKNKVE